MHSLKSNRFAWVAALLVGSGASLSHAAVTYNLSTDFSNTANPNGAWAYYAGATLLPNVMPLDNGNPFYLVFAAGYFSPGNNLNLDTPDVGKAAVDGGSTTGDFLTGDILVHSPNGSEAVNIVWTAPSAGTIDFTSSIWYAHSSAGCRANDVSVTLGGTLIGSATIGGATTGCSYSYFDRDNQWSLAQTGLSVIAGEELTFTFSKISGMTYGSIDGLSAQIQFTSSAVPEPGTIALASLGFAGLVVLRRRKG